MSGMDPLEAQFESEAKPAYFDPEVPDMSEQQFAASLEEENQRPTFVVDATEVATNESVRPHSSEFVVEQRASLPSPESSALVESLGPQTTDSGPDWRDQVNAKVSHYKSRKAPKVRYPSLQLQFESPAPRGRAVGPDPGLLFKTSATDVPIPPPRPPAEAYVSLEATARVIEFPRATPPPPIQDELAEPVHDRPRIVEAPGLLPPPPAMGGILIEEENEQEPERRPGFDMPLQSAPLSRRLLAGSADALLVAGALSAFGYIFLRFSGPIQQWKLSFQLAATLAVILWPAYQYAFLVFTGSTPGLRLAKLTVNRFDGNPVSRSLRRWRVLASLLSCASLGLGYAWCFLDEDQLSWHDRITKTHLAPVNSSSHS